MIPSVFQIYAGVRSYDWGKVGTKSTVAQLAQATPSFILEESKPYAEVGLLD